MNFRKLTILFLIASFLLNGCQGQVSTNEKCREGYKKAKKAYNTYFTNNNQTVLLESLSNLDQAMLCEETRSKSIDLKISVFMILREYKKGYQFIDSLSVNDFKFEYKRKLNHNYFLAMEYEANGDTAKRNKFYYETILVIENYLKNKSDGIINEEIYYDLFLIKSKVLSQKKIKQEITLLKRKNPKSINFFEVLEASLYEDIKIGYFRQN